jgi:MOSC domain-containing protein YiiM
VGLPKEIPVRAGSVLTGIFKEPVDGTVRVRSVNLDGDGQADLKVHGGPDKAVYFYPSEHYEFWRRELGREIAEWGAFGENVSTKGILEDGISIGDRLEIGTAVFQVTQPRLPCFKLAAKFERDDIIDTFLNSRRTGFYTRVLREGSIQRGDMITVTERDPGQVTIKEIVDLYLNTERDRASIERVLSVEALSLSWRRHFAGLL